MFKMFAQEMGIAFAIMLALLAGLIIGSNMSDKVEIINKKTQWNYIGPQYSQDNKIYILETDKGVKLVSKEVFLFVEIGNEYDKDLLERAK